MEAFYACQHGRSYNYRVTISRASDNGNTSSDWLHVDGKVELYSGMQTIPVNLELCMRVMEQNSDRESATVTLRCGFVPKDLFDISISRVPGKVSTVSLMASFALQIDALLRSC